MPFGLEDWERKAEGRSGRVVGVGWEGPLEEDIIESIVLFWCVCVFREVESVRGADGGVDQVNVDSKGEEGGLVEVVGGRC